MQRKNQIIKGLLFSLSISIFFSCQKTDGITPDATNNFGTTTAKVSNNLSNIEGSWTLTKTKNSFPADAKEQVVNSSEMYEFNAKLGLFKRYLDGKVTEEGLFSINAENNNINFLTDSSSSKFFFENNELIIGLRVPQGATLIDYDTYHYFSKK